MQGGGLEESDGQPDGWIKPKFLFFLVSLCPPPSPSPLPGSRRGVDEVGVVMVGGRRGKREREGCIGANHHDREGKWWCECSAFENLLSPAVSRRGSLGQVPRNHVDVCKSEVTKVWAWLLISEAY